MISRYCTWNTDKLSDKYGKESLLTVHHGMVHDYLGMTINYSEDRKVKFMMADYVEGILDEAPSDMDGTAVTPAANHLLSINKDVEKLDNDRADIFH